MEKKKIYQLNFLNESDEIKKLFIDENMKNDLPKLLDQFKNLVDNEKIAENYPSKIGDIISIDEVKQPDISAASYYLDQASSILGVDKRVCFDVIDEKNIWDARHYINGVKTILDAALNALDKQDEYLEYLSDVEYIDEKMKLNKIEGRLDILEKDIDEVNKNIDKGNSILEECKIRVEHMKQISEFKKTGKIQSDAELDKDVQDFMKTVLSIPEYAPEKTDIIDYSLSDKEIEDYKYLLFWMTNKKPKKLRNGEKIFQENSIEEYREKALYIIEVLRKDRDSLSNYEEIAQWDVCEILLNGAKGDLIELYFSKLPESK